VIGLLMHADTTQPEEAVVACVIAALIVFAICFGLWLWRPR
jgi:hypothetical protein